MTSIIRLLSLGLAWICVVLGCVGVFVPVLPTTPLILLATFLFGKNSPRCHAFLLNSRVYKAYVAPFKQAGGMPVKSKVRMLAISYAVLCVSAILVQNPFIWCILLAVAAFLLYLAAVRIPTIDESKVNRDYGIELEG